MLPFNYEKDSLAKRQSPNEDKTAATESDEAVWHFLVTIVAPECTNVLWS